MSLNTLNMAEYCSMALNMPENAWINYSNYARVLSMLWYSYNNIIVTNVIMLEFLYAQFIHPSALLPFYLFQHNFLTLYLEHKKNES